MGHEYTVPSYELAIFFTPPFATSAELKHSPSRSPRFLSRRNGTEMKQTRILFQRDGLDRFPRNRFNFFQTVVPTCLQLFQIGFPANLHSNYPCETRAAKQTNHLSRSCHQITPQVKAIYLRYSVDLNLLKLGTIISVGYSSLAGGSL